MCARGETRRINKYCGRYVVLAFCQQCINCSVITFLNRHFPKVYCCMKISWKSCFSCIRWYPRNPWWEMSPEHTDRVYHKYRKDSYKYIKSPILINKAMISNSPYLLFDFFLIRFFFKLILILSNLQRQGLKLHKPQINPKQNCCSLLTFKVVHQICFNIIYKLFSEIKIK